MADSGEPFAKEIGDWAEGSGENSDWVATTAEDLVAYLRFTFAARRTPSSARPAPFAVTSPAPRSALRMS